MKDVPASAKMKMLEEKQALIEQMITYLKDPIRVKAPLDQDIRMLIEGLDEVAFVDGWGGGS